jgi:hypothetical protein
MFTIFITAIGLFFWIVVFWILLIVAILMRKFPWRTQYIISQIFLRPKFVLFLYLLWAVIICLLDIQSHIIEPSWVLLEVYAKRAEYLGLIWFILSGIFAFYFIWLLSVIFLSKDNVQITKNSNKNYQFLLSFFIVVLLTIFSINIEKTIDANRNEKLNNERLLEQSIREKSTVVWCKKNIPEDEIELFKQKSMQWTRVFNKIFEQSCTLSNEENIIIFSFQIPRKGISIMRLGKDNTYISSREIYDFCENSIPWDWIISIDNDHREKISISCEKEWRIFDVQTNHVSSISEDFPGISCGGKSSSEYYGIDHKFEPFWNPWTANWSCNLEDKNKIVAFTTDAKHDEWKHIITFIMKLNSDNSVILKRTQDINCQSTKVDFGEKNTQELLVTCEDYLWENIENTVYRLNIDTFEISQITSK